MKKHDFLKRVVKLCLVMMSLLTVSVIVTAILARMPIDAGQLGVLMGGWCGELLLTLLKRRWEVDDRTLNDEKTNEAGPIVPEQEGAELV